MAKWKQRHKNTGYHVDAIELKEQDAERQAAERAEREKRTQGDIEHSDDLLAEIDGVLEENAEEFVASFIQKSGE